MSAPDGDEATIRLLDEIEGQAYADLYAAAPPWIMAGLGLRVIAAGGALVLRADGVPTPIFNRAIGLGVHAPASEDDLDAVLEALRDTPFYVHLSPIARPAELQGWMAARGLRPAPRAAWAKVLRGVEPPPAVDTPLAVRELGEADTEAFARVAATAFEMPLHMAPWLGALVGRPGWRVFGAFDGDEMVAGGTVRIDGAHAWLGIGGTLPEHRRKHAQRALMAARVAAAIAGGATLVTTETGEPRGGERNPSLENMFVCGFRRVCTRLNFVPLIR